MIDLVVYRLSCLGYNPGSNDKLIIRFILEKVKEDIKRDCNISDIPSELTNNVVDIVMGKFLLEKKIFDPNSLSNIDLNGIVKQIQEGDVNITFSDNVKTPEQRLDDWINYLINKECNLSCYRAIKW